MLKGCNEKIAILFEVNLEHVDIQQEVCDQIYKFIDLKYFIQFPFN